VKTLTILMLFSEQARGQWHSQLEIFWGQIFWHSVSNSILFGTLPLKAKKDKKC